MSDFNNTVLGRIAIDVRKRLAERRSLLADADLQRLCEAARSPLDFHAALTGPGKHFIAEIKFQSPSEGSLTSDGPPVNEGRAVLIANDYLTHGAAALSILTEEDHFGGKASYLAAVRAARPDARILMKDFVLDRYQILEARVRGADAVLLIVALLGSQETGRLLQVARETGLAALVEVHDEEELQIAVESGAELIGINNRNLKTLEIRLDTSIRLRERARELAQHDPHTVWVAESGIRNSDDVKRLASAGFSAFLVGSSLMRATSPGEALARLHLDD
jgi:indole-3-glycerol phosphate synthase